VSSVQVAPGRSGDLVTSIIPESLQRMQGEVMMHNHNTNLSRKVHVLFDTGAKANFINLEVAQWLKDQGQPWAPMAGVVCGVFKQNCQPASGTVTLKIESVEVCCIIIDSEEELILGVQTIVENPAIFGSFLQSLTPDIDVKLVQFLKAKHKRHHTNGAAYCPDVDVLEAHVKNLRIEQQQDVQTQRVHTTCKHTVFTSDELLDKEPDFVLEEKGDDVAPPWDGNAHASTRGQIPTNIQGSPELQKRIRDLCEKYRHIFSKELNPLPAKITPMKLIIDNRDLWYTKGKRIRPRPQAPSRKEEIRKQVAKMLAAKVIRPSQAQWYSHVLLIGKPDGTWRFCIDFRRLNAATKGMGYPIPNVKVVLYRIAEKKPKVFAVMDLTKGYYQAALEAACRALTAFITPDEELYEWERVPMGLKGAPSYFQECMSNEVLQGIIRRICELYIDDVITFGGSDDEFLENLEQVFQRLSEFNITLNPDKCKLGLPAVEYVGHVIDSTGISFSREKIQEVIDFPKPVTKQELKMFLGLANYFRDHIERHSLIVRPLNALTTDYHRKDKVEWNDDANKAFEEIKQAINACPKLFFQSGREDAEIHVYTDACNYGRAGYICERVDGKEYPLAFCSETFKGAQLNWSTIEQEASAVDWVYNKYDYLLRDVRSILHTDHKNITYINVTPSKKVMAMKMRLQEYNFICTHVRGVDNIVADYLSRLPPPENEGEAITVRRCYMQMTEGEVELHTVAPTISTKPPPVGHPEHERYWEKRSAIVDSNTTQTEWKVCMLRRQFEVPTEFFHKIADYHNANVGHGGVERTVEKLRADGHEWMDMTAHVKWFVRHCPCCQFMSVIKPPIELQRYTTAEYAPFITVGIDTIGPLAQDRVGNQYILVVIDCFTKFIELYAIPSTTALEAAKALHVYSCRYMAPCRILSDRGSQFVNEIITHLTRLLGTQKDKTLPYSHEENAQVERVNKEIGRHLRNIVFDKRCRDEWSTCLPLIQRIHNTTKHSSIGCAPCQLMFGNAIVMDKGPILNINNIQKESVKLDKWLDNMLHIQKQVTETAVEWLSKRDNKHLEGQPEKSSDDSSALMTVGSYVLVRYPRSDYGSGRPDKLSPNWKGPYRVVACNGSEYHVQDLVTAKIGVHHKSLLKPYFYDSRHGETPRETAVKNKGLYDVEEIVSHKGKATNKDSLQFFVKWAGYSHEDNTWEPFATLKQNLFLHDYLRRHKMGYLIPKAHATEEDQAQTRSNSRKRKR
jgi:hypothetical protein